MQFCVTGANRGLGLALTRRFAKSGHMVVLACRSADLAAAAILDLVTKDSISADLVSSVVLDISSETSISEAVATLSESCPDGFDALVNNAAISVDEDPAWLLRINYTGTALFSNQMRGLIKPGGRIVNVGSRATVSVGGKIDSETKKRLTEGESEESIQVACDEFVRSVLAFRDSGDESDLEAYGGNQFFLTYTVSKLALVGLNRLQHMRWGSEGIAVSCCCPGWCQTRMGQDAARKVEGGPGRTSDQGAVVIEWLALHSTVEQHGGRFWHHDEDELLEIVLS